MICFTAIFSDYEELKEPAVITSGVNYICFTDRDFKSDVWIVVKATPETNPVLKAREIKLTWIPDGKSIWCDGSFRINCDLNEFWNKHFISPMTVIQHPLRNCVYKEADACVKNKRGDFGNIFNQIHKYELEGLPADNGLIQSGILMRENTDEVREFCDLWWKQIELSTRDQIGFAYAEFVLKKKWPRIKYDYRTGNEFKFLTHYHRRKNHV